MSAKALHLAYERGWQLRAAGEKVDAPLLRTVHPVIVSRWSEVITTDYRMYLFADRWTPVGEEVPVDDNGLSRARLTGFLGMRSPWSATVLCGTSNGPVRLTVEVHDSPVAPADQAHWTKIDAEWSEIIETAFQVRSGKLTFLQLFGEPITEVELLPIGAWRLRAHAKGRDEGRDKRSDTPLDADPLEEHLLQFWPGPDHGDYVMTRDTVGANYRGAEPRIDDQVGLTGDFPPPE